MKNSLFDCHEDIPASWPVTAQLNNNEDALHYAVDPALYGIPNREELKSLRIWDMHYHGLYRVEHTRRHEDMMFYFERLGIERALSLDISGRPRDVFETSDFDNTLRELLENEKDRLAGLVPIDPSDPDRSLQKIEDWIRNGLCVGIKYYGLNRDGVRCSHPDNDPLIEMAYELDALIYIHTWLKVGDDSRQPGDGNNPGESTPMDVAELAQRFPDVPLICGHSGGDWELGARAVRPYENIYFEFAGSWPHSGQVDLAINELGAERIVWGGHGPSRSFATELSKVLDADATDDERMKIFGGNLRHIARNIFQRQGIPVDPA